MFSPRRAVKRPVLRGVSAASPWHRVRSLGTVTHWAGASRERGGEGGVRVNYICPGAVAWPEVEQDHHDDAFRKEWLSRTPLGKIGTAEDVADAVVFLASPSSSYVTGSGITVCGGRSLRL
ncbi:hypothetical protein C7M84_001115 [Penaeus vannamei]|uniref:Dehydrogenase/reductase SDR family member 6 n=1 Tax=Penaeus vannamei TaxID=6689 RepID=A0A423TUK3_PENVA|nr:hypothetical protein C7M84_001115 [Penaeus vannamei]